MATQPDRIVETFLDNVRRELASQSISISELARRSKLSRDHTSDLIHHNKNLSLQAAANIAAALGKNLAEMLDQ